VADLTDIDRVVLRLCNLLALAGDGINVTSKQNLIDRATTEGIELGAVTHSLTCLEEYGLLEVSADDGPTAPLTVTPAGFEEWASQGVDNFDAVVIVTAQWILADVRTSNAIAEKTNLQEPLIRRVMGLLIDAGYCSGRHEVDGLTVFDCTERFTHQFNPERIVDLKRAEPGQFGRFG
jgi:hypothetical protein